MTDEDTVYEIRDGHMILVDRKDYESRVERGLIDRRPTPGLTPQQRLNEIGRRQAEAQVGSSRPLEYGDPRRRTRRRSPALSVQDEADRVQRMAARREVEGALRREREHLDVPDGLLDD
jgi:hypothetical protein